MEDAYINPGLCVVMKIEHQFNKDARSDTELKPGFSRIQQANNNLTILYSFVQVNYCGTKKSEYFLTLEIQVFCKVYDIHISICLSVKINRF